MNVITNIDDACTMLRKRGLEPNGRAQKIFTLTCAKEMDPYVPMQQGILKNTRLIGADSVTYLGPYARFHYYGKLMLGILTHSAWARKGERKAVTEVDLDYHGAPKRGPFWDRRMWTDKKEKIVRVVAAAAGGVAK